MKKIAITILIVLAVAAIAYGIFSLLKSSPAGTANIPGEIPPSDSAVGEQTSFEPGSNASVGLPGDAPQGDTFVVSGPGGSIRVNNFYKNAIGIVEETQVIIKKSTDYEIDYSRADASFTISLKGKNSDIRSIAETDLIQILGVSKADACKLRVSEYDLSRPGVTNSLSFCSGAFQ